MNNTTNNHVHFIGIGGIGMSALARHYLHEGWRVSGTDTAEKELTRELVSEGAAITYKQDGALIREDMPELVVYTEAIAKDNPELLEAKAGGIETINYFEALGRVANEYYLIAVAGTHGKTTTTAMLADIAEAAGLDPTVVVGSLRSATGSNYRAGKSKYFIVEACEYRRDFLHLEPDVLVITNIEHEHVDYYKDLADTQSAFRELARRVRTAGAVLADTSDPHITPVLEGLLVEVVDYGAYINPLLTLPQPGVHNSKNAAAAMAAAAHLGISADTAARALEAFTGTWRRFEYKGTLNGAPVYDDYAHHPTEIIATISAARERHSGKEVIVVFQPHTYSRTHELFDNFAGALRKADKVFLLPIYAAREENKTGISSEALTDAIVAEGGNAVYVESFKQAAQCVRTVASDSQVVLVMGAGNIIEVTPQLLA